MARKLLIAFGSVFIALLLVAATLPSLISSTWGNKFLNRYLANLLGLHVEAKNISISWLGTQDIQDIKVIDKKNSFELDASTIHSEASLFNIIFRNNFKSLTIDNPNLILLDSALANVAVQKASFNPLLSSSFMTNRIPKGEIMVLNGHIHLQGAEEIALDKVIVQCNLDDTCNFMIKGDLLSKEAKGSLEAMASLNLENPTKNPIKLTVNADKIPLRVLDVLFKEFKIQVPLYPEELFGQTLTLNIDSNLTPQEGNLSIKAESTKLQMNADISLNQSVATIKTPLTLQVLVDKELSSSLSRYLTTQVPEEIKIYVQLREGSCKLLDSEIDPESIKLKGLIATSVKEATIQQRKIQSLSLNTTFNSENLAKSLEAVINLDGMSESGAFTLSSNATLNNLFNTNRSGTIHLKTQSLPIRLIDAELEKSLGKTLSASLSISKSSNLQASLSVETPLLFVDNIELQGNDEVLLTHPSSIKYTNPLSGLTLDATLQDLKFALTRNLKNFKGRTLLEISSIEVGTTHLGKVNTEITVNSLDDIKASFQSDLINLFADMALNNENLTFNSPLTFEGGITPSLIKGFVPSFKGILQNAITYKGTIAPFSINLEQQVLKAIDMKVATNSFTVQSADQAFRYSIDDLNADLSFNIQNKDLKTVCKLQVTENGTTQGKALVSINLAKFDKTEGTSNILIEGKNLPTRLIETCFTSQPISEILSSQFDCIIKAKSEQTREDLYAKIHSSNLQLETDVAVTQDKLHLNSPAKLKVKLTPQGYKVLEKISCLSISSSKPYLLRENTEFALSINKLELPIKRTNKPIFERSYNFILNPDKTFVDAAIECPHLAFIDPVRKQEVILEALNLIASKTNAAVPIHLSLKSDVLSFSNKQLGKEAKLNLTLSSNLPIDKEEKVDFSELKSKLSLEMERMPTSALDFFARFFSSVSTPFGDLFGAVVNAKVSYDLANLNGPVEVNINSKDTKAYLLGNIKDGSLYLKDPCVMQVGISKALSKPFFDRFNPLGVEYIETSHPITLSIDPKGFCLPIFPYNPSNFNLSLARIELGKVFCTTDGTLNIALGLLKYGVEENQKLPLWFTPIDLYVKSGIMSVERLDLLVAESLQLAFWGDIDLVKQYVNMVLGLTAQALSTAFSLSNLPEDYVIQVPVKGPFNNLQIDTKKATNKVAALLAIESGGTLAERFGGSKGAIIGGFLKEISKLPDMDNQAPPPHRPFPWELGKKTNNSEEAKAKKKRAIKSSDSPLKQVLKVIF